MNTLGTIKMKAFPLVAFSAILWGCKKDEPQEAHSRVHAIELSEPLEVVQVTVAGREDVKVSVFERDGRLVAAIVDQRHTSDGRLEEIQRWEMLAKSNKEVALTTRKDFHWLKYLDATDTKPLESEKFSNGTVLYSDTNGDGIPDYLFSPKGRFKVSTIGYEEFQTSVTSFDIHGLPSVTPEEVFPFSPRDKEAQQDGTGQPAIRPESKSEGGDKPQSESEGRSR